MTAQQFLENVPIGQSREQRRWPEIRAVSHPNTDVIYVAVDGIMGDGCLWRRDIETVVWLHSVEIDVSVFMVCNKCFDNVGEVRNLTKSR